MQVTPVKWNEIPFLRGGYDAGLNLRSFDWAQTDLSTPDQWPALLKTYTSFILSSPVPMLIFWGPGLVQVFNNPFKALCDSLPLPNKIGAAASETYAAKWLTLKPLFARMMGGLAVTEIELNSLFENGNEITASQLGLSYNTIKDELGVVKGIMVMGSEHTEKIKSAALELAETQANLHDLLNMITESDFKFGRLIKEAPVAIALLHTPALIIEAANDRMLDMWGKTPSIIGTSLPDTLPDLSYQPFFDLLLQVFKSGEIYFGKEGKTIIEHRNQLKEGYFDFIYQPIKDATGSTNRIMMIVLDVSEQVHARKELEHSYERMRLAKEAAQLGTFDMDIQTGALDWDDRCRELFGINHQHPVTYENDFLGNLHPEDKNRVVQVIAAVFDRSVDNGNYDVEYRTIGAADLRLRWVRAKGRAYFDDFDRPVRFVGSVLDITEQKQDELRKNDFIGMVSHELKTPLTSLRGYVQLLFQRAKEGNDAFDVNILEIADRQVTKMVSLINGFLNISRFESGKLSFAKEDFNLKALLVQIIDEMKLVIHSHRIYLVNCPEGNVFADKEKLGSVIINLLSNAVKYSPKSDLVEIHCHFKDDTATIRVSDEGIGIESRDIEHVFDRYYRVENKNTLNIAGFGIGLYLCAEIIKQHNGKIWVDSVLGKGSNFYFCIPVNG